MREESAKDIAVAHLAAAQHGLVSFSQLVELGIGKNAVTRRVSRGQLHRVHRGVYAVGHTALSREGRWMAAVLACGDGAVLSHRSAAALWNLLLPMQEPIDVSVPSMGGRRRRKGIRLHRCGSLASTKPIQSTHLPSEGALDGLTTVRHRIPVTTPARTIADLRGVVAPRLLRRAIRQAELAGFALGNNIETDRTRSDLERDFLRLCKRAELPPPEVNVRIGPWTVDFLWPTQRLVVETDGYRYHRGSVAFEDDRARDLDLRRRGYEVRRFSGRQLRDEAAQVAADLHSALSP